MRTSRLITLPAPTHVLSPMEAFSPTKTDGSMVADCATTADGRTIARGSTPHARVSPVPSNVAARAKASLGCGTINRGFEDLAFCANTPAKTAAARDFNASGRCFSSSTKTRSPPEAELVLAIPRTSTRSSPTTPAPSACAIPSPAWHLFYTFGVVKGSWGHKPLCGLRETRGAFAVCKAGKNFLCDLRLTSVLSAVKIFPLDLTTARTTANIACD